MEIDLLDIGLRTHEILENALQFPLFLNPVTGKVIGNTDPAHPAGRAADERGPRARPAHGAARARGRLAPGRRRSHGSQPAWPHGRHCCPGAERSAAVWCPDR